jgi:predicted mannosyl-3-phosphoglycerate phosphatase (HAD superfamily)
VKVFATRFLEPMKVDGTLTPESWSWQPAAPDLKRIYASGNSTKTRSSTYAAEKDDRADDDRPNEGYLIA